MADALDPAAYIFEGIWTNWSRSNKAWGLTWTLSPGNAVLVTNTLAVFVTLTGSQLWSITRYTLYQAGAKSQATSPSGPIHKREQMILRNATTDLNTARLMGYLAWSSLRGAGRVFPRTISIAIFAIFHAILFMVAGTFSNLAIGDGSNADGSMVLSRSDHCGTWNQTYNKIVEAFGGPNPENDETMSLSVEFYAKQTHNVQLSLEYAEKCYLTSDSYEYMPSICRTLKKPRLNWNTSRSEICPFQSNMCRGDAKVLVMETDEINSHHDLGINADPRDRMTYRRITQCAVLNDTGRVTGWDGEIRGSKEGPFANQESEIAKAFYGYSFYKNTEWTYAYTNFAQFLANFSVPVTAPYQVDAETVWAPADEQYSVSDFEPISEIAQTEADLILFFLSYTGTYSSKVEDPWFLAQREQAFEGSPELLETRFGRDAAISTIGCTEQHKFCTSKGDCTAFGGFDQIQNNLTFNASLTPSQNATFDRMLRAVTAGTMRTVVNGLTMTSTPLLALGKVAAANTVVSLRVPDNQWERELDYWHSIGMAQFQRTVVQWATGQIAPHTGTQYLIPASEDQDKWFCDNLMIPSTTYQSFSIIKMILVLVFGTLIIVVSLNIETVARLFRMCFRREATRADWDEDDMLKLRMDMRESFWSPTLPSPQGSPPSPKSLCYRLATGPQQHRRPERSPEIRATVRAVPTSLTDDGQDWKRSSSPTLPLEDRAFSALSQPGSSPDNRYLKEPGPIYRPDRESWMAISLSDLQATTTAVPLHTIESSDQSESPKHQGIPKLQRLKNPIQFHLPRSQESWV